jgi:hypothetical protein
LTVWLSFQWFSAGMRFDGTLGFPEFVDMMTRTFVGT